MQSFKSYIFEEYNGMGNMSYQKRKSIERDTQTEAEDWDKR